MRRSRRLDWLLLATLLPLYLVLQAAGIEAWRARGGRMLPFSLTSAQGAEGHPIVRASGVPEILAGDTVVRIDALDLRGLSSVERNHRMTPILATGRPIAIEIRRAGIASTIAVRAETNRSWRWPIPVWASLAVTAVFLLVRAPHWHLARLFFAAALLWCGYGASLAPVSPALNFTGLVVCQSLAMALTLLTLIRWSRSERPNRMAVSLPWGIGSAMALVQLLPLTASGDWFLRTMGIVPSLFTAAVIGALIHAYRRSSLLEKRQLRWIGFGFCVGMIPRTLLLIVDHRSPVPIDGMNASLLFVAAIPLGIAIAVVGYRWLDIDRVISASAAATLVAIAFVGGTLALVPPVASKASVALGTDPEMGRLALSLALAVVVVPAYQRLRPWLDERLFAEPQRLAERFAQLRVDLATCNGVEDLATRAAAGFDALLRPDSIATYALAGEAFVPLLVRGRAAPPAFEAASTLAQVLAAKAAPLSARTRRLDPFERAALETLGAEVVVPVLRDGALVAFTTLGAKRSGDIYTATDLGLLAGVAERSGDVLARLDANAVASEARALQAALRRYVPSAVAERVLAGEPLEPAEREVSVLFVDIRDYTHVAAQLAPVDVFATLNEHTERVSGIVHESGGTIVEFNGDGMMAVFGAPDALPKKEQRAVEAARRIVDSMPADLRVGVGIATGAAFVGSIRSTDRLIWSAVGSNTNLAARLQSLTRELGASIAIDETTRERARYVCADFRRTDDVAIRGREGRFCVYSLPIEAAGHPRPPDEAVPRAASPPARDGRSHSGT